MHDITVESILQQVAMLPPGEQTRLRVLLFNGDSERNAIRRGPPIKLATPIPEPDLPGAMQWLADNSDQYIGQWVALDGGRLIAHGANHDEVAEAAKVDGAYLPLITFVEPKPKRPFVRV
ncbi:MAG: DUF5678 domain-containing protein [Blastocatellia bacterium]